MNGLNFHDEMVSKMNKTHLLLSEEQIAEIRADEREKVLDEVEELFRDWLYSEYGKKANTDNLTIRVINHLRRDRNEQ